MRVLVFEPSHTGHRFAYLHHLLGALAELTDDVVLATSRQAVASEEYQLHLQSVADRFDTQAMFDVVRRDDRPRSGRTRLAELAQAIGRCRPEHVYVNVADGVSQWLGMRRLTGRRVIPKGVEAEALHLSGSYGYPAGGVRQAIRTAVSLRLLRAAPWSVIYHLDPIQLEAMRPGRPGSPTRDTDRYQLMPDPVEPPPDIDQAAARRQLQISEQGRFIGSAGALNGRKGIDLLIEAFAAAEDRLGGDDRLLLAGPATDDIREALRGPFRPLVDAGRIVLIDRHLNVQEMAAAMIACNVVAAPYPAHRGSASIVIRAAAVGRFVLASNVGWIQRTVEQFQLGSTCDVRDHDAFTAAVIESLAAADSHKPPPAAQRFVAFHTAENFTAVWTHRLRTRLGRPCQYEPKTWQWVVEGD